MRYRTLINAFLNALCVGIFLSAISMTGCGGDSGPTVIEPTENYEPTAEEKADEDRADKMMEQGDTSE